MSPQFVVPDSLALADLAVLLGRAARVENGAVRLIADGPVLAVYVAVLYPAGLLDQTPTVLGLRTFALTAPEAFDSVVPVASLLARVEVLQGDVVDPTAPVTVRLPAPVYTASWAAISPPKKGWVSLDPVDPAVLRSSARVGIAEIAAAIPAPVGEQVVHKVRSEIWGRPIPGLEHVPAGGAFAAESLGFLGDDSAIRIFETGPWTRLSTARGHVLVKRRSWSLLA